jgi:CubicO group peptidase (beta-lactamase class C family)/pimeloyl-ACP methyl ester carboxylesterase
MIHSRNYFILMAAILPLLFFSCSPKQHASIKINNPQALDSLLDRYVDEGYYPCLYARLEDKHGNVIYEHGSANQQLLPGVELDGQSWFRIWSMSKIVTISTVLDLVEDGLLSLDDPVTKYIPEFADLEVAVNEEGIALAELENREDACPIRLVPVENEMTVLHLINHQSGFYYATTGITCIDSMLASQNIATSVNSKELIERMSGLPILQQPGSTHFYGTNTTVLGLVAERATGKSLKQLVEDRLTGPLGISGLQYGLPEGVELLPAVSGKDGPLRFAHPGELDIFGRDVPDYDPGHELYLGGEGMLATADGYADFLRMLLNGGALNGERFLDKSTVEEIHAPHTQLENPYGYNGYNLWISGDSMRVRGQGDAGLWIGGGYEGTHFWVDPKREFVGVIMSQMSFVPSPGYNRDDTFRGAVYQSFVDQVSHEDPAIREWKDINYAGDTLTGHRMDIYLPTVGEGPFPVVVTIAGSAFFANNNKGWAYRRVSLLRKLGFAVVAVNHRSSRNAIFPALIQDIKAAVRFLRGNAAQYNLDTRFIGITGNSSGGHLAALMGSSGGVKTHSIGSASLFIEGDLGNFTDQESHVDAVVDWYGPTDFLVMDSCGSGMVHDAPDSPESVLIGGPIQENRALCELANPVTYVDPSDPLFLIMHGDADKLVPHCQSVLLHEALRQNGVQTTLITVPGKGHNDGEWPAGYKEEMARFFLSQWKKKINTIN